MTKHTALTVFALLTAPGLVACASDFDDAAYAEGEIEPRGGGESGGVSLNSDEEGVFSVGAVKTDFSAHRGVRLIGVKLGGGAGALSGTALDAVWSEEGEIMGSYFDQVPHTVGGAQLQGANWELELLVDEEWVPAEFMIQSVTSPVAVGAGFDPWRYTLLAVRLGDEWFDGDEEYLCGYDEETNTFDVVTYDDLEINPESGDVAALSHSIFFACVSGGMGKAALLSKGWGFRPYDVGIDVFEDGVRAVRADYCKNGGSYTYPGNQVYTWNFVGIPHTPTVNYKYLQAEAMWGRGGAGVACMGPEGRDGTPRADIEADCGFDLPDCDTAVEAEPYYPLSDIYTALP